MHRSLSTSSSKTISESHAKVDSPSNDAQNDDTPFTFACRKGDTESVDLLIKHGAHIEHRDKEGYTPLIIAAIGGHTELCKLLIDAGAQLDAQVDRTKDTAFSLACSGGRKDVADLLLKCGANKEHRNLSDYTPLALAASGGFVDIIKLLLNNGAEINSRTNSKMGISPLMLAAMNGHEEATRFLLENGSDINAQIEANKNTALTLACYQGRTGVTRLLIQYGANVEHRAKTGLTPLMEAASSGYVEVGTLLLQANVEVNTSPVPTSRDTALTIAAEKGHAAFVQLLLRHNAEINARNKKGCTPIWLASSNGHLETVKVLVDYKADIEAQDNRKLTPLIVAFRKGHSELVRFLVQHVTQFPSDLECQRFISTLTDEVLIKKCLQSIQYIMEAKEKQAEQANKAAQSLLALLAYEEAIEESKKRNKQRQKEKKKAKKQAKKLTEQQLEKTESENVEEKDESSADEKEQNDEAENREIPAHLPDIPTKKEHILQNSSTKESETQRQTKNSFLSTKDKTTNISLGLKRNKTEASSADSIVKNITNHDKTSNGEIKVNKKRKNVKVAESSKTSSLNSNSNSARNGSSAGSAQQQPNGRRPSLQVLNIPANAIARVIGRGGSNVNMIREATEAHVEVEKQSTRKEQMTRKITLRGSADAVRNAMRMIDLLLKDHNLVIGEIVDCVMANQRKSPSLSSSSETSSQPLRLQQRIGTPPLSVPSSTMVVNSGKPIEDSSKRPLFQSTNSRIVASAATPISPLIVKKTQPANHSNSSNSPPINVWQQRAEAIRGKKAVLDGCSLHGLVAPISTQIQPDQHEIDLRKPKHVHSLITTSEPQVKSLNAEELAILAKEEHQRKAPGYARPQSSASMSAYQIELTNREKTDGLSSTASSLFGAFTSRLSVNSTEPAVVNVTSSNRGSSDLQNSWNYLLEDWESKRQQRPVHPIFPNLWYQKL